MKFRSRIVPIAVLALAATGLSPALSNAAPKPGGAVAHAGQRGNAKFYDARRALSAQTQAARDNSATRFAASAPVAALRKSLGHQAVIDVDSSTLTPRLVARLDGFLTPPSSASPARISMAYLQAHRDVFRLSAADLSHLQLARDYVDIAGTSHLSYVQSVNGVHVFGNGVKTNVSKNGRLINVEGSPVSGLRAPAAAATLSRTAAVVAAKRDLGVVHTAPARGDTTTPVLFALGGGTRAAYQVVTMSVARPALSVIDGVSGRVLYRESLTSDDAAPSNAAAPAASGDAKASVFTNYPGAARGGKQQSVDLTAKGWLPASSVVLFGNNVHTYSDVNDNNAPDPNEEVAPNAAGSYVFAQQPFKAVANEPCTTYICTWNPSTPYSWQTNRSQTSTQNFFFINNYHDHLQAAPIGFTEAAGNFQQVNRTGKGAGSDPVQDEPLDGADTDTGANAGLPDADHIDNANFATPPDGQAPRMQMFLWHQPGLKYPREDPFLATSGSDEADIVYHEYTHGLSHRLVVDAGNNPALDSQQGGSMGEAWSDWYALDYLVDQGLIKDTSAPGEVQVGKYVLPTENFRSESTDCPVGASAKVCPGTPGAGPGGYTYGDFGKIYSGGAEVHADGEIWAQTLWDLRTAFGSRLSESLITRGMELSPTYPSYLDMRNAIIQADVADYAGKHVAALWKAFAHRGMGFFAGTVTGNDVSPVEDFSVPPAAGTPTATVSGTVLDSSSGAAVRKAVVAFGGHDSGFPGSYSAVTNGSGHYTISGVFPGTYPDVYAGGAGYNSVVRTVSVTSGETTHNFRLVRDWAASSGGAKIAASNGYDSEDFGCGPEALIDQAFGLSGWSTAVPASGGRYATIKLPAAVDITTLQVDPTGTCGDDLAASAGQYTLETSTDGKTFRAAASGTFTPADTGHLVTVPLKAGSGTAVRYVRYQILTNQAKQRGVNCATNPVEGCPWLDTTELEVFGAASG